MMDSVTGNENLPNLYIKRVVIGGPPHSGVLSGSDGEGKWGVTLSIDMVAKDRVKEDGNLYWTSDSVLEKGLYGIVLVTNSSSLIAAITKGQQTLNMSEIRKNYSEDGVYIEAKTFKMPAP